jgi:hypothetical protein
MLLKFCSNDCKNGQRQYVVNIMKNSKNNNFKYGLYHNYKAIYDYHKENEIDDKYLKSNHCYLLTFLVDQFIKNKNGIQRVINGERYILMNTNYILDNCIYLKIGKRQLKNLIKELDDYGIIKRYLDTNERYINLNKQLIDIWYSDWTITAISYLQQLKPTLWKSFVNEYRPFFNNQKTFKTFIDDFNDTRAMNEEPNELQAIYDHLINSVKYKLGMK